MLVYTDGSAKEGYWDGGYGGIVAKQPEPATILSGPAGHLCSSYRAEMIALNLTALRLPYCADGERHIHVNAFSDSQSSIKSLSGGPQGCSTVVEAQVWNSLQRLRDLNMTIHVQFVPGHCGCMGNEFADAEAAKGSAMQQGNVPLDFGVVKATIRREMRMVRDGNRNTTTKYAELGGFALRRPLKLNLGRREERAYRQFVTGHSPLINVMAKRWGRDDCYDGKCAKCGQNEDLPHILNCPAHTSARLIAFGKRDLQPKEIFKRPIEVLRYLSLIKEIDTPFVLPDVLPPSPPSTPRTAPRSPTPTTPQACITRVTRIIPPTPIASVQEAGPPAPQPADPHPPPGATVAVWDDLWAAHEEMRDGDDEYEVIDEGPLDPNYDYAFL